MTDTPDDVTEPRRQDLPTYKFVDTPYARIAPGYEENGQWRLEVPRPPRVTTDAVWHYTDNAGLIGILENNTLRASSARMLNDSSEISHGLELMSRAFAELGERGSIHSDQSEYLDSIMRGVEAQLVDNDAFVLCASTLNDDLSQWRGYAGANGYAVGVGTRGKFGVLSDAKSEAFQYRTVNEPGVEWREVVYDDYAKAAIADRVALFVAGSAPHPGHPRADDLQRHDRGSVIATVLEVLLRFKHQGFHAEKEARLIAVGTQFRALSKLRSGRFGATTYVDIVNVPEPPVPAMVLATNKPMPLELLGITVGPTREIEAAEGGLRSALRVVGRDSLNVTRASIPYR